MDQLPSFEDLQKIYRKKSEDKKKQEEQRIQIEIENNKKIDEISCKLIVCCEQQLQSDISKPAEFNTSGYELEHLLPALQQFRQNGGCFAGKKGAPKTVIYLLIVSKDEFIKDGNALPDDWYEEAEILINTPLSFCKNSTASDEEAEEFMKQFGKLKVLEFTPAKNKSDILKEIRTHGNEGIFISLINYEAIKPSSRQDLLDLLVNLNKEGYYTYKGIDGTHSILITKIVHEMLDTVIQQDLLNPDYASIPTSVAVTALQDLISSLEEVLKSGLYQKTIQMRDHYLMPHVTFSKLSLLQERTKCLFFAKPAQDESTNYHPDELLVAPAGSKYPAGMELYNLSSIVRWLTRRRRTTNPPRYIWARGFFDIEELQQITRIKKNKTMESLELNRTYTIREFSAEALKRYILLQNKMRPTVFEFNRTFGKFITQLIAKQFLAHQKLILLNYTSWQKNYPRGNGFWNRGFDCFYAIENYQKVLLVPVFLYPFMPKYENDWIETRPDNI